jgi:hypothetical protein
MMNNSQESLSWLLWILVFIFLTITFEKLLHTRLFHLRYITPAAYIATIGSAEEHPFHRTGRTFLSSLFIALIVTGTLVSIFSYYEGTRADYMDVDVTLAEITLGIGCTTPVDLGTFIGNGDSGPQSDAHSTLCTVMSTNPSGYALHWNLAGHGTGTSTGSLLSSTEETIPSLQSTTPILWPMSASTLGWGARLASKSTTVDSTLFGVDGVSELWSTIGTGSTLLATRTDRTSVGGDQETIGFRAAIGSALSRPAGVYDTSIVFSVITP